MIGDILEAVVLTCWIWGGFFVLIGCVLAYAVGEGAGYAGSGLAMVAAGWLIAHAVKAQTLRSRRHEHSNNPGSSAVRSST
jgi:hypothetical protein